MLTATIKPPALLLGHGGISNMPHSQNQDLSVVSVSNVRTVWSLIKCGGAEGKGQLSI